MKGSMLKKLNLAKMGIEQQSKLVIGVMGTGKGVGTTYSSLLITTYFSTWLHKKTCYIEFGSSQQIESMNEYYDMDSSYDKSVFHYNGVDFYGGVTNHKLHLILGGGYQCIVIDFGSEVSKAKQEMFLCDKSILVTSFKPWKLYELERCFDNNQMVLGRDVTLVYLPTIKKNVNWVLSRYKSQFKSSCITNKFQIPYEDNPFVISEETLKVVNKLFHII